MSELPSIDGYHLTHVIGEGGMGRVYGGQRIGDGLPVAIKVMIGAKATTAAFMRRFDREISVCASFAHPYVIKILDGGRLKRTGEPYFVMELLQGRSLAEKCKGGPINEGLALHVLRNMAEALSYVHAKNVLHRDIKPENIYLEKSGRVVLLDFGLARACDETKLTGTEEVVGTFCTIAPERLAGQEGDVRSDIYGLGMSLYYALAGKYPYDVTDLIAIVRGTKEANPKKLPGLSGELIDRCIKTVPSTRFPSAEALLSALEGRDTSVRRPVIRPANSSSTEQVIRNKSHSNKMMGLFICTLVTVLFLFFLHPQAKTNRGRSSKATAHRELLETREVLLRRGAVLSSVDCCHVGRLAERAGVLKRLAGIASDEEIRGLYYAYCVAMEKSDYDIAYELMFRLLNRGGPKCVVFRGKELIVEFINTAERANRLKVAYQWLLMKYELSDVFETKQYYGYGYALAVHREYLKKRPLQRNFEVERAYGVASSLVHQWKSSPIAKGLYQVWLRLVAAMSKDEIREECTNFVLKETDNRDAFGMNSSEALRSAAISIRYEAYDNGHANVTHGGDIKLLKKAVKEAKDPITLNEAKLFLAMFSSDQDAYDEAYELFNNIDRSDFDDFKNFQYFLGFAKLHHRNNRYDEAIAKFKEALNYTDVKQKKENILNRIVTIQMEKQLLR